MGTKKNNTRRISKPTHNSGTHKTAKNDSDLQNIPPAEAATGLPLEKPRPKPKPKKVTLKVPSEGDQISEDVIDKLHSKVEDAAHTLMSIKNVENSNLT
jgi:hypothetical protein